MSVETALRNYRIAAWVTGIGLLVTLLVRAQRSKQAVFAYGLSEHYRQIFELTRLDEAVGIHDSETDALAAAGVDGVDTGADVSAPLGFRTSIQAARNTTATARTMRTGSAVALE